jgi:Xaa-Pro dipeptidase
MAIDLKILEGKYPAKAHAKKVKEWIASNGGDASGVIYLEGQKQKYNEVRIYQVLPL